MNEKTIFYLVIVFIVFNYLLERFSDVLDKSYRKKELPDEVKDIYDTEEYNKSLQYEDEKSKLSFLSSTISLALTLIFIYWDGFNQLNLFLLKHFDSPFSLSAAYFLILGLVLFILNLPFSWYAVFRIEEKYGFNKTTIKTFIVDKIKSIFLSLVLGGIILYAFLWFYNQTGKHFWWYLWLVFSFITLIISMFYTDILLPIFNKLQPLEDGDLKSSIIEYCKKVGFKFNNIYIMDGSKRTTKANAFFSGFGPRKKIVLYDNLVNEYTKEQIVAVLAHEIGHYKHKDTIKMLIASILNMGVMLYILSLIINQPVILKAFNVEQPAIHISLIIFSLLYAPVSLLISIVFNVFSRHYEYKADEYVKKTYHPEHLIAALKKLSKDSLSNLNPHPFNVFLHYSHPTLYQRIKALK